MNSFKHDRQAESRFPEQAKTRQRNDPVLREYTHDRSIRSFNNQK